MLLCAQQDYESPMWCKRRDLTYNTPNDLLLEACVLSAPPTLPSVSLEILVPNGGILLPRATVKFSLSYKKWLPLGHVLLLVSKGVQFTL